MPYISFHPFPPLLLALAAVLFGAESYSTTSQRERERERESNHARIPFPCPGLLIHFLCLPIPDAGFFFVRSNLPAVVHTVYCTNGAKLKQTKATWQEKQNNYYIDNSNWVKAAAQSFPSSLSLSLQRPSHAMTLRGEGSDPIKSVLSTKSGEMCV